MGFDNECILNIQSLAGEYFCPVCRLLVYPNEALQSQCTHLYCKPCLTYIVGTTHACPYDGYLVTEADSKPLIETNKALAETIGKVAVHCLYHRSGCTWQGQLSECITHCTGCAFGNSPVVCNRCGTQIVHRQVQEHAQNCAGVQPQAQQGGVSQEATTTTVTGTTATSEQNQAITQAGVPSQAEAAPTVVAPTSAQDQSQIYTSSQPKAAVQAVPTPEQWYQQQQQQYQQYYQQYPGYDPYQQQYQQYGQYQQQAFQQQHPPQAIPGQQPQMYIQPQSQPQPQLTVRPQAQVPSQPQAQPQPQSLPQPLLHSQPQVGLQHHAQNYASAAGQQQPQLYSQPQPNQQPPSQLQVQSHLQQRPQTPQSQQMLPQHSQPTGQPHIHSQTQVQQHTHAQMQLQAQGQPPNQLSHAVTGHPPYPQPQLNQQIPPSAPQLQPMYIHPQQQGAPGQVPQQIVQVGSQFPQQQLVQMRPSHSHVPMQQQQHLPMLPSQGQHPNMPVAQPVHSQAHLPNQIGQYSGVHPSQVPNVGQQHGHSVHPQVFHGQTGLVQNTPQQPAHFIQQQLPPQLRPQVPPSSGPPASNVHQQLHQNDPISHGLQSHPQNSVGRPMLRQSSQPSLDGPAGPSSAHAKLMQPGGIHLYPQGPNVQPQSSTAPSQKTDVKEAEAQLGKNENELKLENQKESVDGDEKSVNGGEGKSNSSKLAVKETSESSQLPENNPMSSSQGDEPIDKNMVKEATAKSESLAGDKLAETTSQGQEGISQLIKKQEDNYQLDDKEVQENLSSQHTDIVNGQDANVICQGKISETEVRCHPSQQSHHNLALAHSSRHAPGEMQGSNYVQDRVHQRPPTPDQMVQIMPHQMQVPGHLPTHVRPQGHNMLGCVPSLQGQPPSAPAHFQQSIPKQPLGSFRPEVSPSGIVNPGLSSFGRGPGSFAPQGHLNTGQMPHQDGLSNGGPGFGVPHPGAFDSQGTITGRLPLRGHHMPANMESDFVANMRTGQFESRQPDLHIPGSVDRVPFGQPSNTPSDSMKMNGSSSRGVPGGLTDPSHQSGLQEERFKHFPEERYMQLPEDERNSFAIESGRRIHRREFFDDLKHFPGPTHMGPEHLPKSESYYTTSRPLDRAPLGFTREARLDLEVGPNAAVSRLLPPYQAGGLRPIDLRDDIMGRKVDRIGLHSDIHRSASDLGRFRGDGLPLRSPGREYSYIPSSRFGGFEDIDGRESRAFGDRSKLYNLPSGSNTFPDSKFPSLRSRMHRGEPDVPGNLRIGERVHLRGPDLFPVHLRNSGPVGSRDLPSHMHMGEPADYGTYPIPSRLGDVGGPRNLPLNLRVGEPIGGNISNHSRPGSNSGMPIHGYSSDNGNFNAGEVESHDHSRKRKHGTMGWCRICKVDCAVEGLEMHSQTREHQKKAMDMVLSIKKDNAKKQKISSDGHISPEGDKNSARKTSDENPE